MNFLCTVACVTVQHRVSLLLQLRRFLTRQKGRLPAAVAASVPLPSFVSMPSFDGGGSSSGGPQARSSYSLTLSTSGNLASLLSGHSNGGGASGHLPSVFSRGLSGVLEAEAEADESSMSLPGGASPGGMYHYRYVAVAAAAAAAAGGDSSEPDSGDMRVLMAAMMQREQAEAETGMDMRGEEALGRRLETGAGGVAHGGALFRGSAAAGLRRRHVGGDGRGHAGRSEPLLQRQLSAVDESEHEGLSGPQGRWPWGGSGGGGPTGGPGTNHASARRHTADEAAGSWQHASWDALRGSERGSRHEEEEEEEEDEEEKAPGYWRAAAKALSASLNSAEQGRNQRGSGRGQKPQHASAGEGLAQGQRQEPRQGKKKRQQKQPHTRRVEGHTSSGEAVHERGSGSSSGGGGGLAGGPPLVRAEPAPHIARHGASGGVPRVEGTFTVLGGMPAPAPEDIPLARHLRSSSAPLVARPQDAGSSPATFPALVPGAAGSRKQLLNGLGASSSAEAQVSGATSGEVATGGPARQHRPSDGGCSQPPALGNNGNGPAGRASTQQGMLQKQRAVPAAC